MNKIYKESEDEINFEYDKNFESFVFDLVVYDEIENFPQKIESKNFYYPFSDKKNIIGKYETSLKDTKVVNTEIHLKKSFVCLETGLYN